jgi:uncharacterized membrane protein YbaN (DUF454 family)
MTAPDPSCKSLSPTTRGLLFVTGLVAVGLGVIGIFLPVLPTVPFLLLAAACFTRSSEKFYCWLLDHAHLGPMVRPYLDGKGLRKATKFKAVTLIWASIAISVSMLGDRVWVQGVLVLIALGVTTYLLRLPNLDAEDT